MIVGDICLCAFVFAQCVSAVIWTRYCPGLSHTGMVSTAAGYLDFVSCLTAVSTVVFANGAEAVDWGNPFLIWTSDAPGRGSERPDSKIGVKNVLKAETFDAFFCGLGVGQPVLSGKTEITLRAKTIKLRPNPAQNPTADLLNAIGFLGYVY